MRINLRLVILVMHFLFAIFFHSMKRLPARAATGAPSFSLQQLGASIPVVVHSLIAFARGKNFHLVDPGSGTDKPSG